MTTHQPSDAAPELIGLPDTNSSAPLVSEIATPLEGNDIPAGTGHTRESPTNKITFPIPREQKVTVTYDYVTYGGGSGRTLQRSTTAPGGLSPIRQLRGGMIAAGDTFTPRPHPPTIVVDSVTYQFAFQYVSGGAPIAQLTSTEAASSTAGSPPNSVIVGNAPIAVLVLYVPVAAEDPGNDAGSVGERNKGSASPSCSESPEPVGPEAWGFW